MRSYPFSRIHRVKDLRRVLTDRWPRLPNDETGRALLAIVIDHALLIARELAVKMATQLAPPEMSDAEIYFMIDRAGDGRMWGMQALANAIGLTEADRLRLRVTTIGAVDCTPAQRKSRRDKAKKRRRAARLAAEAASQPSPV